MTERTRPILAITFDLDDTLWDIWAIVVKAEERLHDWLALRYPRIPEAFSALDLRALVPEIARRHPQIGHDRSALRTEALRLAAKRVGYSEFQAEEAFEVFFAARNEVVFFEEVLPVLERLARCYTLGALTNGNADIRLVGLSRLFDFSISATDVGIGKPAPDMFLAACERLRIDPDQILHVGDDPEHDVLGAARVGMRTVWVNRDGRDWPGGRRADAEVRTLEELEAWLGD